MYVKMDYMPLNRKSTVHIEHAESLKSLRRLQLLSLSILT